MKQWGILYQESYCMGQEGPGSGMPKDSEKAEERNDVQNTSVRMYYCKK